MGAVVLSAVGLGTLFVSVVVIYWQDLKVWVRSRGRREEVVVSEAQVNPKSVPEIVRDALVWAGCYRIRYQGREGEHGAIWAPSPQAAVICLERHGIHPVGLEQMEWSVPRWDDLIVYEEEICSQE